MKTIEVSAKTLDAAITEALIELGASSDQVKIEVLEEGGKGVLGLFGKDAKIRATLKEEGEELSEAAARVKTEVKETVQEAVKEAVKPAAPAEQYTVTGEKVVVDDSLEKRIREANAKREAEGNKPRENKSERSDKPAKKNNNNRDRRPEQDTPAKEPVAPVSYEIPADSAAVIANLNAFLKEVLEAMGMAVEIESAFSEEGILEAAISSANPESTRDELGVIIGTRGATLDSLQYLATLVVNKGRADHVHIKLDTNGYRARRQETLETLALSIARKVKKYGRKISLEPMNPYERRIIHATLQNFRGVETYSDGEEPYRKVIVAPTYNRR